MYGEIKQLLKHGSIYTVGIVLSRIVAFVMIPVYTNCLTPAEYGVLELLGLTADLISTSVGMGMAAAVMRFYFKHEDPERRNAVISTSLLGVIAVMGLTVSLCIVFSKEFSRLVFSSEEYTTPFRVMFLSMFFSSAIEIPLIFLRAKQKSVTFVVISLVKMVIQLGLNIFFLVYLKMGVIGVLYSTLISAVIISLYLIAVTWRETGIRFDKASYKDMLRFGAPLIMADLSIFGLTYADHYMLNYFGSLTVVGLYSLAYKFGMLVSLLFATPFRSIWTARMFEIAKQENGRQIYAKVLTYFLLGSLTISLGISCFSRDALRVMAEESYWSAYHIVPLIAVSYVAVGVIAIAGAGLMIMHRTKYIALSTTCALVVNIVLCILLIPIWGAMGAAIVTLVSYFVRLGIDAYNSQKLFRIDYEWRRIIPGLAAYVVLTLLAVYVEIDSLVISLLVNGAIVAAYPVSLLVLGVFTQEEKTYVKDFFNRRLKSFPGRS
ncbi:MAG: flippase [candidate division Zixibacteria bacterium]|nr:flippase [candidate division Zixibacteria bacterium]